MQKEDAIMIAFSASEAWPTAAATMYYTGPDFSWQLAGHRPVHHSLPAAATGRIPRGELTGIHSLQ